MTLPQDPYLLSGPLTPASPRDPNADTVIDESERGTDGVRGDAVDSLLNEPARPLTDDEEDAARHDAGRPNRTYAPASERVSKPPAPGDEKLIEQGLDAAPAASPGEHAGDRSDPAELR
jgi:hypothetical protein